jgi:hypothetical protein
MTVSDHLCKTLLIGSLLLVGARSSAQGEWLRALGTRHVPGSAIARAKSDVNSHYIYVYESQVLPLMDDFSVDRTRKRWAQVGDPGVGQTGTVYRLEVDGASTPEMVYSADTTFRFSIDLSDPDVPVITRTPLPMVQVLVRNIAEFPPTANVLDAWPAYTIFDTLQSPPEDTLFQLAPDLVQDSLLIFSVDPDPRRYVMNGEDQPLILWEDDDVHVNASYPINPPTVGVATFDGLARTGLPYNFAQYGSYGIADRLTSVPIDLSYSVADSVYLSFFYQPRGRSGDAEVQAQDSLVLEFYAPLEDQWVRVWRTPYGPLEAFRQVMIPIKEDRFLRDGFRMRFLNYATLSGSFDHWHLDYVRLDENRSISDTVLVDMAYVEPASSLLRTYTSVPFHAFEQSPGTYMTQQVQLPIRNLDVNDRFITWRMRAGLDGDAVVFDPTSYGNSTSGNASSIITSTHPINASPNNFVYDPELSEDAAFWRVRFLAQTQPDINSYNDTVSFVQELSNYYAYDDGSAEMGYGLDAAGAKLAYRFDIVGTDSLRAVRMYFNPQANQPPLQAPTQGSFLLTVWSSLEPEVVQMQNFTFSSPTYRQDGIDHFVEYALDSTIRVEGTFYVGWTQTNAVIMNLGFDRNLNNQSRISYNLAGNWQNTSFQGSLMMRPVMVADVDPFIGVPESPAAQGVFVAPNPARDELRIHAGEVDGPMNVEVVDASGRSVWSGQRYSGGSITVLDWADGLYLVRMANAKGDPLGHARVVVQH